MLFRSRIGLALSGGGVRAATFHMGVLKRLAEEDLLERVSVISTVSGGSLVMAAVMTEAGMKWPSSIDFLEKVYPAIRARMTSGDLFSLRAIGWRGLLEFNVDLVRNRASVLARLLERNWGVSGTLADLPDFPHWLINTTCFETGKNWRFAKREMGDWSFGRHYAPEVSLSVAAAASAAVPYVIGAMRLSLPAAAGGKPIRPPASRCARVRHPGTGCGFGTAAPTTTWASKPSPSPARVCAIAIS